jgi:hypothetical protein
MADRQMRLLQKVDGDPFAEITLDERLTQLSEDEKNRCVLIHQSVGLRGGQSRAYSRLGRDNFRDSFGDSRVPATRSLAYT